jgi:hypothetical protein
MLGLKRKTNPNTPQNETAVLVADLDKIVAETAAFRLHGTVRYIRPIPAEKFFRYAAALGDLSALKDKTLDQKSFVLAFFEVIKNVVDPITLADVEGCTLQQIAALYSVILDCVTGKEEKTEIDEKKKTTKPKRR